MTADNFKVEFFKNRILNRLEELKPFMSGVKYKLYTSMINDCSSLDEIRDMAELDMQFNMIRYIRELDDKLKLSNTNIEELEAVTNQNVKAAKLTIISPQKKVKKEVSMYEDFDFSTLGEDLEDDDLLASAANLLMMRFNNEPADVSLNNLDNEEEFSESDIDEIDDTDEDFYSAEYDNEDTDGSEEDDFEIEDCFEIEDVFDIEGDFEEDTENEADDFEEDTENEADDFEIEGDFEDFDEDFEDTEVTSEVNEDDEIIDFGNEEGTLSDNSEDEEETDWDTLGDDLFNESCDLEEEDEDDIDWDALGDDMFAEDDSFEDEDDIDWDSMESEMLGDESDIEDYDDDEETDWDTLGDDMFAESDNFEEDDESEETDWDTLGDDMFEESDDFDDSEYDEESDEETNWDTLGDDAFDEEELDSEYEDTDEEDEDAFDSIDNISADDLFSDVDDESFEDVSESSDNIDDMFDIDESELGFDSNDTSDNFDDFFNRNITKQNSQNYNSKDRVVTVDKVFINGTKRGNQTQQMFNLLNSIFDNTGKLAKKTISTARSSQNTNRGNGYAVKRHI